MTTISRRSLLKTAGAITAVGAVPVGARMLDGRANVVTIRAVAGVPAAPLPAYASYVLEGYVDPAGRSGTLTRTVVAGAPAAASDVALPGLSQAFRVTDVRDEAGALRVRATATDRSQLRTGESATLELVIDRKSGTVRVRSGRSDLKLALVP